MRERLGWINRRQPLPDIEPHLAELGEEIPATQRRPFMPIDYASWAAGQPEHRLRPAPTSSSSEAGLTHVSVRVRA